MMGRTENRAKDAGPDIMSEANGRVNVNKCERGLEVTPHVTS